MADLRPGTLFEIVDRQGLQFYGQLLHSGPVAPSMASEIRQALVSLPALPTMLKPKDMALTPRALPVGVLERPGGVATLQSRLEAQVTALGKREATLWLLRQFAALSADLSQVHQTGFTHGAVTAGAVVCAADGDVGPLQLSAFGVHAFARGNDPQKAAPRRADLVDLLGALHELFTAGGLAPEGGAAAKWMLLRASAQHGEHPALASGSALASALTEMASLRTDDAPRPSMRAQTLVGPRMSSPPGAASSAPPGRNSEAPGRASTAPPGRRPSTIPPGGSVKAPTAGKGTGKGSRAATPAAEEAPAAPTRPPIRVGVVAAGLLAITGVVAGGVYYALRVGREVGVARLDVRRAQRPAVLPGRCEGESHTLQGIGDFQRSEFEVACVPGPDRVALLARKGTEVVLATRAAARGQRFGEARAVARGAVELGSSVVRGGVLWFAWRNGVGDPFGVARIEGDQVATVAVPLPAWDSVPLQRAWLVEASAQGVWIVTNVATEGGAHVILLQVTFAAGAPVSTAWNLADGTADSVLPGPTPSVLVRAAAAAGGWEVREFTLNLAGIESQRRPAEPTLVRGAPLPAGVLTRSEPLTLPGPAAGVVDHGVAVGGAHAWLAAVGGLRPGGSCDVPLRCHGGGPVSLLTFAPGGAPRQRQLLPVGWVTDIASAGAGLQLLVTRANVAGAEVPYHSRIELADLDAAAPSASPSHATGRSPRARIVACGGEPWVAFDATQPTATLTALPLACTVEP